MFESGDYVLPRVQDRPRLNKPPLIYWLQCGSVAIFGDGPGQYVNANIWVFRVPSVLCAIGTLLITWRIGLRVFDPRAAALGAALLAVCPMVVWDAHQARADQSLLLMTTAAMWGLLRAWLARGTDTGACVVFWLAIGLGVLAKGPVTPLVAGLTAVALGLSTGRWAWLARLRPVLGTLAVCAIVGPWVALLGERVGWSEFGRTVVSETLGRSTSPKENHWFPPGFHLVLFSALFWPGSLLTGLAFGRAAARAFPPGVRATDAGRWTRLRHRLCQRAGDPRSKFLICWIVPAWVFFELISTKLPHYVMPLYPALALVSARGVLAAECGRVPGVRKVGSKIGFGIWVAIGAGAMIGLSIVVLIAGRVDADAGWFDPSRGLWLPGAVLVVGLIAAARAVQRGQMMRAQVWGVAMAVVWGATFLQTVLPSAGRLWISRRIAEQTGGAAVINASKFREDSLIFVHRGRVERADDAAAAVADTSGRMVLMQPEDSARAAAGVRVVTIEGWNYSNGKPVRVLVAESPSKEPRE